MQAVSGDKGEKMFGESDREREIHEQCEELDSQENKEEKAFEGLWKSKTRFVRA